MSNAQYDLTVLVKDPSAVLFQGKADAISTHNTFGPLDILHLHENFISIITKEVIIHNGKEEKKFPVDLGIITVTEDNVTILLGVQTLLTSPTSQETATQK